MTQLINKVYEKLDQKNLRISNEEIWTNGWQSISYDTEQTLISSPEKTLSLLENYYSLYDDNGRYYDYRLTKKELTAKIPDYLNDELTPIDFAEPSGELIAWLIQQLAVTKGYHVYAQRLERVATWQVQNIKRLLVHIEENQNDVWHPLSSFQRLENGEIRELVDESGDVLFSEFKRPYIIDFVHRDWISFSIYDNNDCLIFDFVEYNSLIPVLYALQQGFDTTFIHRQFLQYRDDFCYPLRYTQLNYADYFCSDQLKIEGLEDLILADDLVIDIEDAVLTGHYYWYCEGQHGASIPIATADLQASHDECEVILRKGYGQAFSNSLVSLAERENLRIERREVLLEQDYLVDFCYEKGEIKELVRFYPFSGKNNGNEAIRTQYRVINPQTKQVLLANGDLSEMITTILLNTEAVES